MFAWLKKLSRLSAKPQPRPESPPSLEELLRISGKVNSRALTELAHSIPEAEFVEVLGCAALVGSAIRSGEVLFLRTKNQEISSSKTLLFKSSMVADIVNETPLSETIFVLRKELKEGRKTNFLHFNIGRAPENDIRIVDFAVSRFHSRITVSDAGYAIADLNSRNGTRVNGVSITVLPRELQDGDLISFGRYEFTLMNPESLYRRLASLPLPD
jgi:hypothetical protein